MSSLLNKLTQGSSSDSNTDSNTGMTGNNSSDGMTGNQTGNQMGNQMGNTGSNQNEDYGDKGLDFLEKKSGHSLGRDTNEKITDGARGQFEKMTGKDVPSKFSN
ncbi:hypothetical protein BT96DRAFT_922158 [Gymnopus androsaceus JB14]|uniref:Uncharacterized protein n=1 Tax=Gymnopus androsaceus JB14 TaxID=1447944 RepID=A0A6A4HF05_9AGAR|nr:hypothetical protein BT96DRAFT_922158 [Gymnopus androsaceus JB14]